MNPTYLVQRLTRKPKSEFLAKVSQVFGGGMMQISSEGWKVLQEIFDIDYMGSAEFEFGALPKCIYAMSKDQPSLTTFQMTIPSSQIKPNARHEHELRMKRRSEIRKAKEDGKKPPRAKKLKVEGIKDTAAYVICRKEHTTEAESVIRELALDKIHLKEGSHFAYALDPASEHDRNCIGWLELDNGFFWFIDYEAYAKTAKLFELTPVPPPTEKTA